MIPFFQRQFCHAHASNSSGGELGCRSQVPIRNTVFRGLLISKSRHSRNHQVLDSSDFYKHHDLSQLFQSQIKKVCCHDFIRYSIVYFDSCSLIHHFLTFLNTNALHWSSIVSSIYFVPQEYHNQGYTRKYILTAALRCIDFWLIQTRSHSIMSSI